MRDTEHDELPNYTTRTDDPRDCPACGNRLSADDECDCEVEVELCNECCELAEDCTCPKVNEDDPNEER